MRRRPFRPPDLFVRLVTSLVVGLIFVATFARADQPQPFEIEVNILSATIRAGETPIATVHRGTKLVAHEFNGSYYLVDLPSANPPQQGWIAKDDVHRVVNEFAEAVARVHALPLEQRDDAKRRLIAMAKEYDSMEVKEHELLNEGRTNEAFQLAQKILENTKETTGTHDRFYASALCDLGVSEANRGEFASAGKDIEAALTIDRQLYGEKHADVARDLSNLGEVAFRSGDFPTAERCYKEALAIRLAVFGEKDLAVAGSYQNLGCVATMAADGARARAFFERALAIDRETTGNASPATAIALDNVGMVAAEIGDFATAAADFNEALAIQTPLGLTHPDTIATLCDLGQLCRKTGDYPSATKYYTAALENLRQFRGDKNPEVAHLLQSLGTVSEISGDYKAARAYLEQSLAIRREVLGERNIDTASSLGALGDLAFDEGDFSAALHYDKQALECYQTILRDTHPRITRLQAGMAWAQGEAGDFAAAMESMQRARRTARRYVAETLSDLTEREQLEFLQTNDSVWLWVALSMGAARRDDPRLAVASAGWLLNGKAVAEEALSAQTRLLRNDGNPAAAQLAGQLTSVRSRLASLSLRPTTAEIRDAKQAEFEKLTSEEESLSRQLAAKGTDVAQPDPWVSIDDLRRNLPDDSILVDFARLPLRDFAVHAKEGEWKDPHYVAWIIAPTRKAEVEVVDLGPAEPIERAVQNVRTAIQRHREHIGLKGIELGDASPESNSDWRGSLAMLAKLIWQPLELRLKGYNEVILSPDAALWLLPWAALPTDEGRHFVLEKWQIRYVTSARDLVSQHTRTASADSGAAVFADPDYDLQPQAALAETKAILSELPAPPTSLANDSGVAAGSPTADELALFRPKLRSSDPLGTAIRLPGTAAEANAMRPALAKYLGVAPRMFLGDRALEGVVKKLKHPRVLVLSTHGFFFAAQQAKIGSQLHGFDDQAAAALDAGGKPIENPLLRCGLLLAGCNHRDALTAVGVDDGVLTGLEIVGCDLRGTELVVLSACDTGLGDVHNGEGVAGLRQAFQLAGARSVVASLWQVPDAETSQLMGDFFANLAAGQTKAQALRNAQLSMINAVRRRGGEAPPFFWAAFTLTGQ